MILRTGTKVLHHSMLRTASKDTRPAVWRPLKHRAFPPAVGFSPFG
jgi:hypothetical protein